MLQTDSLVTASVSKTLKHDSIIMDCLDIHWCVSDAPADAHFSGYFIVRKLVCDGLISLPSCRLRRVAMAVRCLTGKRTCALPAELFVDKDTSSLLVFSLTLSILLKFS